MTLRLNNYMTIQTSEGAPQTSQGALDRQGSWTTLQPFANVRCNIQTQKKRIIRDNFSVVAEAHMDIIYHNNRDLFMYPINQAQLRVVTHPNSFIPLTIPITDDAELVIYEFKGHIQQIKHRTRVGKYVLLVESNAEQIFA